MTGFLKTFGKGVLYVVLLPFIIAFVAIYMVYLLITFFVMLFKNIIMFFMGKSPLGDLKEDKEAKKIIEAKEKAFNENQDKQNQINQNTTNNSTITYNQNLYVSPNDLMEFFNQQANKNNQRVLDNQSFPEITKEDDPLFLESTKEGGNDNE